MNVFNQYKPIIFSVSFGLILYVACLMGFGISVSHNESKILGWSLVILLSIWVLALFLFPSAIISIVSEQKGDSKAEIKILWGGSKLHYRGVSLPFQVRLFFLKRGEYQIYVRYNVNNQWNTASERIDLYENREIEIKINLKKQDGK